MKKDKLLKEEVLKLFLFSNLCDFRIFLMNFQNFRYTLAKINYLHFFILIFQILLTNRNQDFFFLS